ncbi:MAG TPA: tetratricopeptide repeat protein, partial [Chloroflexota bacterium]
AHNNLGVALRALGKPAEAAESFREAIALKPDYLEAYNGLGAVLGERGEQDEAVTSLRQAVALNPDYAEAHSNLGLTLMAQGKLDEALVSLRRAAELQPDAAAYANLGVVLRNQGKLEEAHETFRTAVELNPDFAPGYVNLGVTLRDRGERDEALAAFRRAVELDPTSADAHTNLGVAYGDRGEFDDAIASLRRAIELKPDSIDAHANLGAVMRNNGKTQEALESFRRAIELKPSSADGYNSLGVALRDLGRMEEAQESFRRALELNPDLAEVHNNLGLCQQESDDGEAAVASLRRATELKPDYAEAHNNLGMVLRKLQRLDEAVASVRRAIEVKPDFAEAYSNLGVTLGDQGKHDEAVATLQQAIALKPDYAEGYSNLAVSLRNQDRFEEAIAALRRSLELKPDYAEAHANLAVMYGDLGDHEKAFAGFERAVSLTPDYADAHFALSMIRLVQGDLANGFEEYEWRWRTSQMAKSKLDVPQPEWAGDALEGRTIFLYAEQGLGDTLQFARYAPLVAERGGRVILECQSEIAPLLRSLAGVEQVVVRGEQRPPFDVHAPLLSLPYLLGTELETVPAETPYLHADPARVAAWGEYLDAEAKAGLRVGLVWAGNPDHKADRRRSMSLEALAPLAEVPGVHFFALQKGPAAIQADAPPAGLELTNLGPLLGDFADTAAVIENLDLVITVDTSVAHLAGALGRPFWVALAVAPDWRWLLAREESPWYPTARLFRQERFDDWAPVMERVASSLAEGIGDKSMPTRLPAAKRRRARAAGTAKRPVSAAMYVAMPLGTAHGWGVCGRYLTKGLALRGETRLVTDQFDIDLVGDEEEFHFLQRLLYSGLVAPPDSPVLQAILGTQMVPSRPTLRGRFTAGYTFFEENILPRVAIENAWRYFDLVVTGSTWCQEVLESYGLQDVRTIIQGIDPSIFFPLNTEKEHPRDQFVVFSGGKLELRKGQDLVIRAFKVLQDRHSDVQLLNSWSNPWDFSFNTMRSSPHIRFEPTATDQVERINQVLADNGIDLSRVTTLPPRRNVTMPEVYRNTDVGLFPNRCEGGTNLVLMEYMACGRPVIASYNSGHRDVVTDENAVLIRNMGQANIMRDGQHAAVWDEPNLEETVEALEWAYQNRGRLSEIGHRAGQDLAKLTWERTADQFYDVLSNGVRVPRSVSPPVAVSPSPDSFGAVATQPNGAAPNQVLYNGATTPQEAPIATDGTDEPTSSSPAILVLLQHSPVYEAIVDRLADQTPVDSWHEDGLDFFAFELLPGSESAALSEPPTAVFAVHPESMRLISAVVATPNANGAEPQIVDLKEQLAKSA